MPRLPQPGSDQGTWGDILNDFLGVEHNPDGTLKSLGSLASKANASHTHAQSDITNLVTDLAGKANSSDLAAKAPLASPAFTGTPTGITKTHVGLSNVDNTSDAAKPVSTAQAAADSAVQATAIQRANHTGTQSADTLTDGTINKAFLATERTKLAGIATGATANQSDATTNAAINLKHGLIPEYLLL